MRAPQTLRSRLALAALVAAAVGVLLLTLVFDLLLGRRLDHEESTVLHSRAAAAASTVSVRPDGSLEVSEAQDDTVLDIGIWIYQGRTAVQRPPGSARLQRGADRLAGTSHRLVHNDDGGPATAYLSTAVRQGPRQVGTVVAAISLDPYRRSLRLTVIATLVLGAVLVALVFLLARSVAARALTPVAEMTRQAGEWSVGDSSLRFGRDNRPGELDELAQTLDGLLDRLSAVLRREQQISAEISHELRTPLAGIVAEVELFQTRPRTVPEAEAAMAVVGERARRLERILDTLLAAARATIGSALGRCDAVDVAKRLAGPEVPVQGSGPVWTGTDDELLERLLAPLLDNARRYAAQKVDLEVRSDASGVLVVVNDDGPGVPAADVEAVFEPGRRLDSQDGHAGAGLGLSLARRLTAAAGGELSCRPGPGGHFVVRLPKG